MRSTTPFHQLATYTIASLPTVAGLAKETVYMPSAVAARVLGTATIVEDAEQLKARQPGRKPL